MCSSGKRSSPCGKEVESVLPELKVKGSPEWAGGQVEVRTLQINRILPPTPPPTSSLKQVDPGYWVVELLFHSGIFIFPDSKLCMEPIQKLVCCLHPVTLGQPLECVKARLDLCGLACQGSLISRFTGKYFRGEVSCFAVSCLTPSLQ